VRVVVAPDSFGGTLSAVEAAEAIASGWRDGAPADVLVPVPLSDGGPGFVDVLHAALGGERRALAVPGPLGDPVTARYLLAGATAYVEAAQAAGLHLVDPTPASVRRACTLGTGLVLAAAAAAATRVVVGVGGTATTDGGAGVVHGLGFRLLDAAGGEVPPTPEHLAAVTAVTPVPLTGPEGVDLVVASDVDNPLLGVHGAAAVYGPQKGADRATVLDLDDALRHWADVAESAAGRPGTRERPGAGAGGGLGFALLLLGASRCPGFDTVADAVRLADTVAGADLVVTGEGSFDGQSLRGKVVSGVARTAQEAGVPCIVVAGQSSVGRREAAAAGVDDVVAAADVCGSAAAALAAGAAGVARAAAAAARTWARA
jgi:glycerate kinase